jgi:hypothetical protein
VCHQTTLPVPGLSALLKALENFHPKAGRIVVNVYVQRRPCITATEESSLNMACPLHFLGSHTCDVTVTALLLGASPHLPHALLTLSSRANLCYSQPAHKYTLMYPKGDNLTSHYQWYSHTYIPKNTCYLLLYVSAPEPASSSCIGECLSLLSH